MFCKIALMDIKRTFQENLVRSFIIEFVLFSSIPFIFTLLVENGRVTDPALFDCVPTYGDCLLYIFGGIKIYKYDPNESIQFPALWLLVFLLCLQLTTIYPEKEQRDFGLQILVRSHSRQKWLFAKEIWIICSCVTYFAIAHLVILLSCLVSGCSISLQLNEYLPLIAPIEGNDVLGRDSNKYFLVIMVLLPMVMIALENMQLFLSLSIRPSLAFVVIAAYLLLYAYFPIPLFIGHYGMVCRSNFLSRSGVDFFEGCLYSFTFTLLFFFASLRRISVKNLL